MKLGDVFVAVSETEILPLETVLRRALPLPALAPFDTRFWGKEIGQRLRKIRIARGLTQAELAGAQTKAFVSAVETGRSLPSLPSLRRFAARLDVPMTILLGEADVSTSALAELLAAPESHR